MSKANRYRELAADQIAAADVQLVDLDLNNPNHKILVGLVGRMNATLYRAIADVFESIEAIDMSEAEGRASRSQRLRLAAIRGDDDAMRQIIDEELEERQREREQGA